MRTYSEMEGEQMVRVARAAIELSLRSPHLDRHILFESLFGFGSPNGVFVTIYHYPTMEVRSRSGLYGTGKKMGEQVVDAAIDAAFKSPNAVPVSLAEADHLVIGVDVILDFEEIRSSGKGKLIKVKMGRDGLYLRYGFRSAALLPSFPNEHNLDRVGFFEAVCRSVGIQKDLWMQPKIVISKFQTQVFVEEEPDGKVREVKSQG